jgi:OPT family small oligopeptide transporter
MDTKEAFSTSQEIIIPPLFTPRHVPDVPDDVEGDYLMDHLNDPNFDLKGNLKTSSYSLSDKKKIADGSEYGPRTDSDAESTARHSMTGSTMSDFTDFDDESPYPEVRAAVASIDDPSIPVNTFRMWTMGIFFTVGVSILNQFFSMRYPSVYISGIVCQLLALPFGKLLERILPTTRFRTFGLVWSLNPGPFNVKEHVLVTVMANIVTSGAYATDITATQRVFYNETLSFAYQLLLPLSSQIIGFAFAGYLRKFIVWPASMVWPGTLVNCALFNTLHRNYGKHEGGHISRERFFLYVFIGGFVWYWIPGYLFTALSVFNWVCWITPNNIAVNALFGTNSGLGMGIFTFDWAQIAYIGSPLVTPWWSELNTGVSFVIFYWIVVPIIYFTNSFWTGYLPISSHQGWTNTGVPYNVSEIITNNAFDLAKYQAYSPLYISSTLFMAYGLAFATFTSIIVHSIIWYRRDINRRLRRSLKDEKDIHSRLMSAYPEVPWYWFATVGIIALGMHIGAIYLYATQLPVWGLLLALFLASFLALPVGIIQAVTNQQVGLQVMHELIAGYAFPGKPVANMIFKGTAFIGTTQAVGFSADLKLGHYMKIPPRMMFAAQTTAVVISCFTVVLTQNWMFNNIVDFCSPTQQDGFICPATGSFATASMIWGSIGPQRLFSIGRLYNPIMWMFLVGALSPIPFYFLARRYPLSFWRYVNMPVFFSGVSAMPPASGINYSSWIIVGFIFQYFMRRFHFRWWMRYNYILSAALDAGVAASIIIIFFAVQYPNGGYTVSWWGNNFWQNTADANGVPMLSLSANQSSFGFLNWS